MEHDPGFEYTLSLLHGWLGKRVSVWVHFMDGRDSVAYMTGTLRRGEELGDRHATQPDKGDDSFFFQVGGADHDNGFFLGAASFVNVEEADDRHLLIKLQGWLEIQVGLAE